MWRPALAPSVVVLRKDDVWCFLRPELPDWLVGNRNVAAILSRCDGQASAHSIAAALAAEHGALTPQAILNFLRDTRANHALFADQRPPVPPARVHALRAVHLSLTEACNLHCVYCYATDRLPPKDGLTLEEYTALFAELALLGRPLEIVLTGGEPTLHPHWLAIARRAKELGHTPQLLTNGTRLTPEAMAQCAELFGLIKVSIDGSRAEIHDAHRGAGSFQAAMTAVEALLAHNAPVELSMTVTQQNIRDIPAAAERFGSLLHFAPLFKAGRAVHRPELDISGEEYYAALTSARGVNPLSSLCSVMATARQSPIRKCALGDAEMSIAPDGQAYPCHLLHFPEFGAGNIRHTPLADILAAPAMRHCRNLTVETLAGCRECTVRLLCGGACRARVFHATGDIAGKDPFCVYEERAYLEGLFAAHTLVDI